MIKNTFPPASSPTFSRVVTNDLYLAAYLYCEGCCLDKVYHNERKRVSFVFVGKSVQEKKQAFIEGKVFLNVGSFRRCLNFMRDLLPSGRHGTQNPDERSFSCPMQMSQPEPVPQT